MKQKLTREWKLNQSKSYTNNFFSEGSSIADTIRRTVLNCTIGVLWLVTIAELFLGAK